MTKLNTCKIILNKNFLKTKLEYSFFDLKHPMIFKKMLNIRIIYLVSLISTSQYFYIHFGGIFLGKYNSYKTFIRKPIHFKNYLIDFIKEPSVENIKEINKEKDDRIIAFKSINIENSITHINNLWFGILGDIFEDMCYDTIKVFEKKSLFNFIGRKYMYSYALNDFFDIEIEKLNYEIGLIYRSIIKKRMKSNFDINTIFDTNYHAKRSSRTFIRYICAEITFSIQKYFKFINVKKKFLSFFVNEDNFELYKYLCKKKAENQVKIINSLQSIDWRQDLHLSRILVLYNNLDIFNNVEERNTIFDYDLNRNSKIINEIKKVKLTDKLKSFKFIEDSNEKLKKFIVEEITTNIVYYLELTAGHEINLLKKINEEAFIKYLFKDFRFSIKNLHENIELVFDEKLKKSKRAYINN